MVKFACIFEMQADAPGRHCEAWRCEGEVYKLDTDSVAARRKARIRLGKATTDGCAGRNRDAKKARHN